MLVTKVLQRCQFSFGWCFQQDGVWTRCFHTLLTLLLTFFIELVVDKMVHTFRFQCLPIYQYLPAGEKMNIKFMSFGSSHQRSSMKKGALRNFTKFTGKYFCQSLFFNKVVFLWILRNFREHLFYRTPLVAASERHEFYIHVFRSLLWQWLIHLSEIISQSDIV